MRTMAAGKFTEQPNASHLGFSNMEDRRNECNKL